MNMAIERPLDFLNSLKGKKVIVVKKGSNPDIEGELLAFDIHLNLVIQSSDGTKFIRGDVIETVTPGA